MKLQDELKQRIRRGSNVAGAQVAVEYVAPGQLVEAARQLRKHTRAHVRQIARSIAEFGFLVPILVDAQMRIVAGDGRWLAATELGLGSIPVIRVEHLTEGQQRLFTIADNKLPEGVKWDCDALLIELNEIELLEPNLDLTTSGLAIAEIDTLRGRQRTGELDDFDLPVAVADGPATCRVGDLWQLGRHVLACGDARDAALVARLLASDRVRMVLSDPPWNLAIPGTVSGGGRKTHDNFVMASGEMSKPEFITFLADFLAAAEPQLTDGALLYLFMDWRNLDALAAAAAARQLEQKNLLIWCKDNAGMGSLYRSQHELVGLYKFGREPHVNNILLGKHGRNRSNLLFYPGVNSFSKGRAKALETHPTCKPIALLADLILDASGQGDLVLDCFGGSGSTLVAAERVGRKACLVELDPRYADAIVKRYEALTGEPARLSEGGRSFADTVIERAGVQASAEEAA